MVANDLFERSKMWPMEDFFEFTITCFSDRTFFINGRRVDMPTETLASIESKMHRVSNMAKNLHQIK